MDGRTYFPVGATWKQHWIEKGKKKDAGWPNEKLF